MVRLEEHTIILHALTAQMELLLGHNGIAPPNLPIEGRRNGPQGRQIADIPGTCGTHYDDISRL